MKAIRTLVGSAPWWVLSVGFHLVLLLGATLVYMERLLAVEGYDFEICPRAPRDPMSLDYPRDLIERRREVPPDEDPLANPDNLALFSFDLGSRSPERDPAEGDAPRCEFPMPPSRIWGTEPERRIRRLREADATNILRTGQGNGYGQRSEHSCIRETLRRSFCCNLKSAETSVDFALNWLARHQNADGSWSAGGFCPERICTGDGDRAHDTGVTALATLAFLGAGYSHFSRGERFDAAFPGRPLHFGDTVKKAEHWLLSRQDAEGCVGDRGPKFLYDHAIASLALSEAYGMTATEPLRLPAQKAIDFLVAAQNPGKGWRYSPRCGDNDTSVTGWAIMALKSAEMSELPFPKAAYESAVKWLDEATEPQGRYKTGYTAAGTGKVYVPGRNEAFADHPTMSAVSVLSRVLIRKSKREPAMAAVMDLQADLPQWESGKVDFYYWYYASLALFQYDGPHGGLWSRWNQAMKDALVANQKMQKNGCENGSWDPAEDRWGFDGGRVYATALNCMTLEVYYRYANVFGINLTH
jgi:hypothetical protein